jgi:hypothetical protein
MSLEQSNNQKFDDICGELVEIKKSLEQITKQNQINVNILKGEFAEINNTLQSIKMKRR